MWRNPNYPAPEPSAPPEETGTRLATFNRGRGEEQLRVCLDTFEGHRFVSIRLWARGRDGNFWPTRKGCSIRLRELPELVEVLGRLEEAPVPERAAASGQGKGVSSTDTPRRSASASRRATPDHHHGAPLPLSGEHGADEPFNEFD
jgi:hypothetical protein